MTKNEWRQIGTAAAVAGSGDLARAQRIVASLLRSTRDEQGIRDAAAQIGVSTDLGDAQLATGGMATIRTLADGTLAVFS
jgi:hypothetical protein